MIPFKESISCAALLLLWPAAAQAAPLFDQQHGPLGDFAGLAVATDRLQIQTFTVGVDGILMRIELKLSRFASTTETVDCSLWSTDVAGLPASLLAARSVQPSVVNLSVPRTFVSFDLESSAIGVFVGQVFALVLTSNAPNNPPHFAERYEWEIGQQYDRGAAYTKIGTTYLPRSSDFHFKTVVDPVPEANTALLTILGLGGLFSRRCRPSR